MHGMKSSTNQKENVNGLAYSISILNSQIDRTQNSLSFSRLVSQQICNAQELKTADAIISSLFAYLLVVFPCLSALLATFAGFFLYYFLLLSLTSTSRNKLFYRVSFSIRSHTRGSI